MALALQNLTPEQLDEYRYRLEVREYYRNLDSARMQRVQECARLEVDLAAYFREVWPILNPGTPLIWSWVYDYMCEWLTLVYTGQVKRLIINISPRTGKSLLASVAFPTWVWAKRPTHNFACASYAEKLSFEHSIKRRTLIQSDWYQQRWGNKVKLARDQNEKSKFQNTFQAQMIATSVNGTIVGLGGNTLILDDGMNPEQVVSDAETLRAHRWFDGTWKGRLNDPGQDSMVVIEQRTGERDITGHCMNLDDILSKRGEQREWTRIAIPLVNDEQCGITKVVFPISGRIVIREIGDVLIPDRYPAEVVKALQVNMLVYETQHEQRPAPLEGHMIKRNQVQYYGGKDPNTGYNDVALPIQFDLILITADCAFKDLATSDFVAVIAIGVKGPNKYILEVTNNHLDLPATEHEIRRQQQYWQATVILVEDKANGPAVIKSLKRNLAGVIAVDPEGGKIPRMFASAGEWQAGNWFVFRNAAWCEPFITQITTFPGAKNDDMADAMTQAAIHLQRRSHRMGYVEWIAQEEERVRQEVMAKQKNLQRGGTNVIATVDDIKQAQERDRQNAKDRGEFTEPEPKTREMEAELQEKGDVITAAEPAKQAVDHHQHVAKVDQPDDGTPKCGNCGSKLLIRIAGGIRCQQCGRQSGQALGVGGAAEGQFRK